MEEKHEPRSFAEARMLELNLNQAELRRMTKLPKETISRVIRGEGGHHVRTLTKLAEALECTVDYLLTGKRGAKAAG